MKNLFINTIVAIICFTLGYVFYPTINESNAEATFTNNVDNDNAIESYSKVVKEQEIVQIIKADSISEDNSKQSIIAKEESVVLDKVDVDNQVTPIAKEKTIDETVLFDQKELEEWSVVHKEQINELVTAHMSSENAEHMKSQISKDNDFLSQPSIKQDAIEDENWAYNMEQQLKIFISQHELSENFELLNLSCKQLMCDVFGVEKESNTWFPIYVSLLQNAPMVDLFSR
jgi:hypothetical protein